DVADAVRLAPFGLDKIPLSQTLRASELRRRPMRLSWIVAVCIALLAAGCATRHASGPAPRTAAQRGSLPAEPYQRDTVLTEAESFFGRGARGVAQVVNRVLDDNG